VPPTDHGMSSAQTAAATVSPANRPTKRTKAGLVLGFTLAGILLVVYASATHPVLQVPLTDQFGLLQEVPLTYWLGLGLLAFSVFLAARGDSDLLFVVVGAAFLGMLAGSAALLEPNPPVWDSYLHFASAETIVRTGRIPTDPSEYAANWPGLFLVAAFTDLIGGLAPLQFVTLFPIFSGCFTFLALFVFLRAWFPAYVTRPASILTAVLNVWAQYHVSPQGIGLSLALLVLATAWDKRVPVRVANAALFLGLVLSHATSTIFLLGILGLDVVIAQFFPRREVTGGERVVPFGKGASPFVTYVTVWLGWLFFIASGSAETAKTAVATQIGSILQVGEATAGVVASRSVENIYVWPPRLRLAALGVFGIVSLISLFVLFRKEQTRSRGRFFVAAFLALGVLGLSDILFFGGQIYDRAFMFFAVLAPPLCLLGLHDLHLRPSLWRVVVVGLLVASVAAAATSNYQEPFYLVNDQSMAVSQFLSTHGGGVLVLDGVYPEPVNLLTHQANLVTGLPFYTAYPLPLTFYSNTTPSVAVFDPTARIWYVQGHGINIYQYYEAEKAQFSVIYDSGYAQIYLLNGAVPGR
jgi:hypothetical protein